MYVSKIKEVDSINKNISKIIVVNEQISSKDLAFLHEEFGYDRATMDRSLRLYRNIAIVLDLMKIDTELSTNWMYYLKKHFPTSSKLDNVLISKDNSKLLLITNRRLVTLDLKRVNEKIAQINSDIEYYNKSLESEEDLEKSSLKTLLKKVFG